MTPIMRSLKSDLELVRTTEEFEAWVRGRLRAELPHAGFLATMGRLYGLGSVPTHRIGVEFPLNIVEALKNAAGAIDDPLVYAWFRTGRPRFVDVGEVLDGGGHIEWCRTLYKYGIRNVSIHGVLDHASKRFSIFQMFNSSGGSVGSMALLSDIMAEMSAATWRAVEGRGLEKNRGLIGHPTRTLTATELQIVEMLARGLSNKEIARIRGVSDSTVKTQVQRTGAKLGATRRAEIVAIAIPMLSPLPPQGLIDYDEF